MIYYDPQFWCLFKSKLKTNEVISIDLIKLLFAYINDIFLWFFSNNLSSYWQYCKGQWTILQWCKIRWMFQRILSQYQDNTFVYYSSKSYEQFSSWSPLWLIRTRARYVSNNKSISWGRSFLISVSTIFEYFSFRQVTSRTSWSKKSYVKICSSMRIIFGFHQWLDFEYDSTASKCDSLRAIRFSEVDHIRR